MELGEISPYIYYSLQSANKLYRKLMSLSEFHHLQFLFDKGPLFSYQSGQACMDYLLSYSLLFFTQ